MADGTERPAARRAEPAQQAGQADVDRPPERADADEQSDQTDTDRNAEAAEPDDPDRTGVHSPAPADSQEARRSADNDDEQLSASEDPEQQRPGRRPEGPAHAREGSALQTLKRTLSEFSEDNLTDSAAALTYYAILSIFPALLALVAIVGLVGDPQTVTKEMTTLVTSIGPASAAQTFKGPIEGLTKSSGTAGILLIVGIAAALWTRLGICRGVHPRVERDLRGRGRPLDHQAAPAADARHARARRPARAGAGRAGADRTFGEQGRLRGRDRRSVVTVWNIAKWPVLLIVVMFMIALLYYASPNAKLRSLKSIFPGAVLAVVVWLVASAAFAFYVANFGSYNKTYGTLGGIIIFLVWMWITNVAILLGAEVNAERERSRQLRDGTPGAEREIQLKERSEPKAKKRARTV